MKLQTLISEVPARTFIAGKGRETHQIIKGQKSHFDFDDREVVKEFV